MVMFGEMLPPEPMQRAARWAHDSNAVLAIGSTLSIYPAASVVAKTARRGQPLVIVNRARPITTTWPPSTGRPARWSSTDRGDRGGGAMSETGNPEMVRQTMPVASRYP